MGAVRLLTVHGAKGLEAQCVLMLDTDAAGQKAETMGALVDWPGEHEYPQHFVFLASESNPPPSAEALLASEQRERKREELNTLYVAMTRAKECLVISATQPGKASSSASWWTRLEECVADLPAPHDASTQGAEQELQMARILELPVYAGASADASSDASNDAMHAAQNLPSPSTPATRQGEAMHQLLEQAGVIGPTLAQLRASGWSEARVSRLAREFDLTPDAARTAARIAQRILQGEGAWAWDAAIIDQAINEAPLVYQGESLRLDRLVRRRAQAGQGAEWWVLDYKSAPAPESQPQLIEQLRRYLQAVRLQLGHEGAVHAALLSGDGRLLEVHDDGTVTTTKGAAPSAAPRARADNTAHAKTKAPPPEQGSLF
ncbi:RecBCD enzyme subunit RecB [bioreactor metagenome]|uniref:RecBCD enzyme subunit RecB n=1 Tax=bioreactor metagenome TaxID=1076179 RepID=A0A645CVJ7_9ZZZZ